MTQEDKNPFPPGSIIGILGGGQLGRMLSLAAARLGFQCHIYDPVWGGPASHVSRFETNASYENVEAVLDFAKSCDVVTYEFENVPALTAKTAASAKHLRPNAQVLNVAQRTGVKPQGLELFKKDRGSSFTFCRKARILKFMRVDKCIHDIALAMKSLTVTHNYVKARGDM